MPKEGRKQAVLRKNVSKKRKSGFRGTSVHDLKRQNKEKRPTVGVTFVDEDDVVSELIPPPAVPASSRKIQVSETESLSDENSYNAFESANGYRLVSMDSLRKFCNRIHSHSKCSSGHVELEEDCTSRFGLSSSIYARCDECGMSELLATGYHKSDATLPNTIQGKDLNRRVVYGAFEMGLGMEGIAKLCEVLDMPFSISIDTWYRHEDALLEAHTDVVKRRDSKRVKQAETRVDKQYKNYRIMRRQAKQRDEELRSNREGANDTTQGKIQVQVGVFSSDSFTKTFKYIRFPIHLDVNSNVFVEVEVTEKGQIAIPKECHVSAFKNYNHNPVLEYELIKDYCPDKYELNYLESNAVSQAIRFKFPIRQYFGIAEQFLFIHCKVTTCQRRQPPKMTATNCRTLAHYCPHRRGEIQVSVGPFVVLPEELKQDEVMGLANGNIHTHEIGQDEVQVKLFDSSCFSQEYPKFPIPLGMCGYVYVEAIATQVDRVVIPEKCQLSGSKHFTDHLSSESYTLLEDSCPLGLEFDYLPTHNKAVRFRFSFDHFNASAKDFLYLHCLMTTCQRGEVPRMAHFNCLTQTQYCPHHINTEVSLGPFMVWPEGCNQEEKGVKKRTGNSSELKGANNLIFGEVQVEIFANDSFTEEVKYNRFPIHLDLSSVVFIEVEAIWQELVAIPKECHITAYKNCSDHHPSLGYGLVFDYCPDDLQVDFLRSPMGSRAVRFKFPIRQFFGIAEQFLYLHCKMTTCKRKDPPMLTMFNCRTQSQFCPLQKDFDVTVGPFMVWPVGIKRDWEIKENTAKPTEYKQGDSSQFSSGNTDTKTDEVCLTYAEVIMSVVGPIVALGLMIVLRAILRKAYIKRKRQIELAMETDKEQA